MPARQKKEKQASFFTKSHDGIKYTINQKRKRSFKFKWVTTSFSHTNNALAADVTLD